MRVLCLLLATLFATSATAQPDPAHVLDDSTRARLQIELREMALADQRIRSMWEFGTFSPCRADSLHGALADLPMEANIARTRQLRAEAEARVTDAEHAVLTQMLHDTDARILARLREIIARHGWPSDDRTGANVSPVVFLLHAPHAIDDMRDDLLAEVQAGRLPAREFAMAVDKAQIARGELQFYGSGNEYDAETESIVPPRIADIEVTNAARREIGMAPLESYRPEKM